jgi:DNA-binding CsgD family transcriptional regulator
LLVTSDLVELILGQKTCARALQRILPDAVGSDPVLMPALVLGQAGVLLACGQVNEARIVLREAGRHIPPVLAVQRDAMLAEMAREEIILPFLQMQDVFADLLARHPGVASQWPVPRTDPQPELAAEPAPAVQAGLPDPLTQRELTILRFLATSMSTMEIADELCLSVNTVKTHLAAIYRKLPASRRRAAGP